MEAEEQEDPVDSASGIPEDSYDQWAMDIEAEFQSPDDDVELSLEDAEAAGATPGAVRVICSACLAFHRQCLRCFRWSCTVVTSARMSALK